MAENLGRIDVQKSFDSDMRRRAIQDRIVEAGSMGIKPHKLVTDPAAPEKAKSNFLRQLGMALSTGAMAYAEGMGAGKPYSTFVAQQQAMTDRDMANAKAKEDLRRWNVETGMKQKELDLKAPEMAGKQSVEQWKLGTDLRKEFQDLPEIKTYNVVKNQVNSIDKVYEQAVKGDTKSRNAYDQALITIFNKVLDPTSVVRESEYARTPENQSVVNKMVGAIEKFQKGGSGLTKEDLKQLNTAAKIIANEYGGIYNQKRTAYTELAAMAGTKPEYVLKSHEEYKPFDTGTESKPVAKEYDADKEARYQAWKAKQGVK